MFNLDEYTTVRERIIEFWKRYPNGRIETEILEWSDKRFIVRAAIYRETTDQHPFATGLANEVISDRGVNKDFALENGATSAIGIACGNANIGVDKHKSSREEMKKVIEVIKKVPAPSTMDQAVNVVADILGTDKDTPHCAHGAMVWKAGVTKTGKPWGHYKCSGAANGHNDRCPKDQDVIWYEIKPDGSWGKQKARM